MTRNYEADDQELRDVVLVQCAVDAGRPEVNRRVLQQLIDQADVPENSLIVLPELCTTGYSWLPGTNRAECLKKVFADDMSFYENIARAKNAFVLGATSEPMQDRGTNAAILTTPAGVTRVVYRKIHLISQIGEPAQFTAGTELGVARVGSTSVLTSICYDLRFPELFRKGAEHGCEVITVQANWPASRQAHWESLLVARAIENQAWVIGVNRVGTYMSSFGLIEYRGGSLVVSPAGDVMVRTDELPAVAHVRIDRTVLNMCRRQLNVFADRKFHIQGPYPSNGRDTTAV